MKKKVAILGSTGSIGTSTLDVIASQPDSFQVSGLACGDNIALFNRQIDRFRPTFAGINDASRAGEIVSNGARTVFGPEGMKEIILDADIIVNALPGSTGLGPSITALDAGKILALANKESLVMGGRLIERLLAKGSRLFPVDSEHSALYQLLEGRSPEEVDTLVLTASGGPFRDRSGEELATVTVSEALNHPTWKMGTKITLDSATLMNKGLEVIEAKWLFRIDHRKIEVLIHPQSLLHGMIGCTDGSLFAYLAYPDMKIPISYALNEGTRRAASFGRIALTELRELTFSRPDTKRFPALQLAYDALDDGDSALITLNAANEVASAAFLRGAIRFTDMAPLIEETLTRHPRSPVVEDEPTIRGIDEWARDCAGQILRRF